MKVAREVERTELLPELLSAWLDEGHDLGNHTFSHHAFENVGREAFEIDVLRGEATTRYLMESRGRHLKYFRYPFLHAPAEPAEKAAFEEFLERNGYRVAPVTLDNDEWIYAWAYSSALDRGDAELAQRIGLDYARYMSEVFQFNETFARELLGRELPQILRSICSNEMFRKRCEPSADLLDGIPQAWLGQHGNAMATRGESSRGPENRGYVSAALPGYEQVRTRYIHDRS